MKSVKLLLLLIGLCLFVSCKEKNVINKENLIQIHINTEEKDDFYDIGKDVNSDFNIISLETNGDCLLGYIRKIISTDRFFYIQDNMSPNIFIFDKQGAFVSKLDKRGNGPDEYINISSFTVIEDNIWIYDDMRGRLVCYNKELEKKEEVDIKIPAFDMISLENNIFLSTNWVSYGKDSYQLKQYDLNTQKTNEYYPFSDIGNQNIPIMKNNQFTKFGDRCLFICSYDDVIYEISGNEVKGKYQIQFSSRYEDIPLTNQQLMSETNKIRGIDGIEETSQSIILKYEDKGSSKMVIYNKASQQTSIYSRILVNSKFGNFQCYRYFITNDNEIISLYDPDVLINYGNELFDIDKMPDNEQKSKLVNLLANLNTADNPIIITYNLNESSDL